MDFENLKPGLSNVEEMTVTEGETALKAGSGSLKVLATPVMVCLMEKAATNLAEKNLPPEFTSVGTSLEIKHIAPTPVNMKIRTKAILTEIDGRKLIFEVSAADEVEEIGKGRHERFIVKREKFQSKADEKIRLLV